MTPLKLAPGRPIPIRSTRHRRSVTPRRSSSIVPNTAWQKRDVNHRSQLVQAMIRRSEVVISPRHAVRRPKPRYAFVLENGIDLFKLPPLGYTGIREVREIKRKVLKNQMTQKDIERIAAVVVAALKPTMVTKTDIAGLKTDVADLRTEVKADIAGLRTEVNKDIAGLRTEVKKDIVGLSDLVLALHATIEKRFSGPSNEGPEN